MGWPIVGDAIYGGAARDGGPPLQLHSRAVSVPLYPKKEPIAVTAPVPAHMRERLTACGWEGERCARRTQYSCALMRSGSSRS